MKSTSPGFPAAIFLCSSISLSSFRYGFLFLQVQILMHFISFHIVHNHVHISTETKVYSFIGVSNDLFLHQLIKISSVLSASLMISSSK